ncbi:MAG: RHS repeat-associated core domain-containing protein [Firmicutes bacterium]|nr:RHS repeat-associated core domain-containing protein [Bacillota bacterium]
MLQQYDYTYDNNGNILIISEGGTLNASYEYDGLNRLIRENNTWSNKSYAYNYDTGGNLTTVTTHAFTTGTLGAAMATENYAYNNANWKDQLTTLNSKAVTYDALGNPATYDGFTFTWARGRLLTKFAGPGLTIQYDYDAAGHRIRQIVTDTINNKTTTTNFIYSGDLLMRQSDGTNTLDFQYDANSIAVGFNCDNVPYYYLRNLQGDVIAITDATGAIVGEYNYDAWGNTALWGSIALKNPIRYRGYYEDSVTGWYWLNTRWYIPQWRRFVNADALFIAGADALNGSNMYAYCNNNPVMYADPSGMGIFGNCSAVVIKSIKQWSSGTPS